MRVAFTLIGGHQWTGGRNYLLNLLAVLTRYESGKITPVLFVGMDCAEPELAPFAQLPGVELVYATEFNADARRVALIQALLWGRDRAAAALFKRHRIDVVFEAAQFFGWRLNVPAVAWIPDFQHRLLPKLFSPLARLKRELGFRAQIAGGRIIMLSSNDARRACEHFYLATRGRTHTVNFAILPSPPMALERAQQIACSYGLTDPFFFMPNQFWQHKNHGLVLEALAILSKRGQRVLVAASGNQSDPRVPSHFPALRGRITQLGLEENFRLLGLIPYEHVAALMRACIALINPSLFEGWSTTVEEARLLGTPMLLSNLEVHQEQMGKEAMYFDRYSPATLADCLGRFEPLDDSARERALVIAQGQAERRARAYASTFAQLVQHCIHNGAST